MIFYLFSVLSGNISKQTQWFCFMLIKTRKDRDGEAPGQVDRIVHWYQTNPHTSVSAIALVSKVLSFTYRSTEKPNEYEMRKDTEVKTTAENEGGFKGVTSYGSSVGSTFISVPLPFSMLKRFSAVISLVKWRQAAAAFPTSTCLAFSWRWDLSERLHRASYLICLSNHNISFYMVVSDWWRFQVTRLHPACSVANVYLWISCAFQGKAKFHHKKKKIIKSLRWWITS